jgi:uncharacterized protein
MQNEAGAQRRLSYDPHSSRLVWEDGEEIDFTKMGLTVPEKTTWTNPHTLVNGAEAPGVKWNRLKVVKIQLGLKCNYECSYCLQRFQPEHDDGDTNDVLHFIKELPTWFDGGKDGLGEGVRFEFWGGEPFVYWKKLRLLGSVLKSCYPNARFNMVSNGSVLSDEIIDWIDQMGISIGISHDGPGQPARGPDPFEDPVKRELLFKLYDRLVDSGRITFNVTLTAQNYNLEEIAGWFVDHLEGRKLAISLEGVALPYTDEGFISSLGSPEAQHAFAERIMRDTIMGPGQYYSTTRMKLQDFIYSVVHKRPSDVLRQKCGMDRPDQIAVTLKGDVMTCQNVSPTATAENGQSHKIGTVKDLAGVRLTTSTHWKYRKECSSCPVLQLCKGSCMFLQNEKFKQACDNEFAFNMGIMGAGLFFLTHMVPVKVEGPIRASA